MVEIFGLDSLKSLNDNVEPNEAAGKVECLNPGSDAKVLLAQEEFSDSDVNMDEVYEEELEKAVEKEARNDRLARKTVRKANGRILHVYIISDSSDSGISNSSTTNTVVNDSYLNIEHEGAYSPNRMKDGTHLRKPADSASIILSFIMAFLDLSGIQGKAGGEEAGLGGLEETLQKLDISGTFYPSVPAISLSICTNRHEQPTHKVERERERGRNPSPTNST